MRPDGSSHREAVTWFTQQVMEIPESLKAHMSLTDPLLQSAEAKGAITGLLMLPEGPVLMVARPINGSNTKAPIRGS